MHFLSPALRLGAALSLVATFAIVQHAHVGRADAPLAAPFDQSAMDTTANACKDFFGYATGTYRKNHPIPAAYSEYGYIEALEDTTRSILRKTLAAAKANPGEAGSDTQKIGAFYGSCLDTASIEQADLQPITPELARIASVSDRPALLATLAHLRTIGVDVGFAIDGQPDFKNSERVIATISQAGLGLPERDYYFRADAASRKIRTQYQAHVQKMLAMSGDPAAALDTVGAYAIETALARGSKPAADLRDPAAVYHPMQLAGVATLAPHLEIAQFLSESKIPTTGTINVATPSFLGAVDRTVASAPLAQWRAYLRSRLIEAYAPTLPKRFDEEAFAFNGKILSGQKEQLPRWKRCIAAEDQLLGEAVGRAYVAEAFPPSAKARALDMSERIRKAYGSEMNALTWMTPATKRIAVAKLNAMVLKVGYPERWRSYAGYDVVPTSYFANVKNGRSFAYAFGSRLIGRPVDHSLWYMTPQTVNAYNAISPNEIVLPAAQLQRPFFDENAPDPDNLGATGAGTVGHEMTHGFDDEGHKFDLRGNLANWWTPTDLKQFDARANCVIKQFDDTVAIGTTHYQGRLDSGEAIADLGGVVIGYRALEDSLQSGSREAVDGFTPEQRYFLAFAQSWTESVRPELAKRLALTNPHPIPRDRVNNTVANVPEWYAAFHCGPPPKAICRVW